MSFIRDAFAPLADPTSHNGEFPPPSAFVPQYALVVPKAYGGFGWRLCDEKGYPLIKNSDIYGHFYSREAVLDFLVSANFIPVLGPVAPEAKPPLSPPPHTISVRLEVELVFGDGNIASPNAISRAIATTILRAAAGPASCPFGNVALVRVKEHKTQITQEAGQLP